VRRGWAILAAVSMVIGLPAVARGAVPAPCTGRMAGGDWATYGEDLHGTQRQLAENTIGKNNLTSLKQAWITADTGYQSPPPIVSGGCVFINTNGHIEALDLQTGSTVWQSTQIDTTGTFAVTVVDRRVLVGLYNGGHPQAAALDVSTGKLQWISDQEIYFGHQANQESSAVVFDGLLVVFTTGPEGDTMSNDGYGIIDIATGHVRYKAPTMPPDLFALGYRGGGVWGTPTVDRKTGYLYVGTSNPNSKTKQSAYDNAIIKLDLDQNRSSFGTIVATYKGDSDSVTGYDNPVCQSVGDTAWVNGGVYAGSPTCGQTDVDFGVGPTLWRDHHGRLLGAAMQKSGVLHVFNATTMQGVWSKPLGPNGSFADGNLARIATDGDTIYVAATPGFLWAFDATDFTQKWVVPLTGSPQKGGNVALANGVLYYVDDPGLKAFDPANGNLLWMSQPEPGASIGSGVAIAGHTIIANHYGKIAAYRLG
jgi:polyvinyl alcohol dehydrogenase (cytochrome)